MRAVGTQDFLSEFRAIFAARIPFATFLMMRFDPDQPPVLLEQWIEPDKLPATALVEYVDHTYAFDPFYRYRDLPPEGGVYQLSDIAPDRFFFSEYYLQYYRRTGLCDEVGLLAPLEAGSVAHLSLSRLNAQGPFRRREIGFMRHFAPVLLELLSDHCTQISSTRPPAAATALPPLSDLIRAHASETLGIAMTRREAQIAALVLQGHSNGSAALTLNIAMETSKVHRRNLYRKLRISSQRELFGLFKHLL